MAAQQKGSFDSYLLADGTRAFRLRFKALGKRRTVILHDVPGCTCGCGGGWDETAARNELGNNLARVRAGVWEPREAVPRFGSEGEEIPTFEVFAERWLEGKLDGTLSEEPISQNTAGDYRWRLNVHLLPFFGRYRLDEIDRDLCLAFKSYKLREAAELREALDAGAEVTDRVGRPARPLAPSSHRKLIDCLASILDEAIEDGYIDQNPARSKRMRVRVPKPQRTFLEMDELAALLDAAAEQDTVLTGEAPAGLGRTAEKVRGLALKGLRPPQIAAELGLAKATVTHHLRNLGARVGPGYVGRRVVCEILGRSGVRASELCDLKVGQVRLHDPAGAHFHIPDAKTETGVREVQMSPELVEAVVTHLDRLRRVGRSTTANDYLAPNLRGSRIRRQRVWKIVAEAADLASQRLTAKGLPPLPSTTPHTLRRTYISIALLANNFDVKWVMGQVGHANSKMTLDVYAQLEQRVDRSHGTSFDDLIRRAREELKGVAQSPDEASSDPEKVASWSSVGHDPEKSTAAASSEGASGGREAHQEADSEVARARIELATPRFSVVCSTN
jgi:integrase